MYQKLCYRPCKAYTRSPAFVTASALDVGDETGVDPNFESVRH